MFIINKIVFEDCKEPIPSLLGVVKTKEKAIKLIKEDEEKQLLLNCSMGINEDEISKAIIEKDNYIMHELNICDLTITYLAIEVEFPEITYFTAVTEEGDVITLGNMYLNESEAIVELNTMMKNKLVELIDKGINFDLSNTRDEHGMIHHVIIFDDDKGIDFYIKIYAGDKKDKEKN